MAEAGAGVVILDSPPRGRIDLRGDAGDPGFVAAVATGIGAEPPTIANTARPGRDAVILWLGPDEWLIEMAAEAEAEIAQSLENALSGLHASVAAIGDGSVTFSVSGPRAADMLAKGMTLDLHPDRFPAGRCARSLLARIPVLLHRPDGDLAYELTVARSYSDHARLWLEDAALEYVQAPQPDDF